MRGRDPHPSPSISRRRQRRSPGHGRTVLLRYWHGHAEGIPSADQARKALDYWSEFSGDAAVAELTIPRQQEFVAWLAAREPGVADIGRILSVGKAALNCGTRARGAS